VLQPLMEEFRLKISRSPDLSVFLVDLLSDGDSAYSIANFVTPCSRDSFVCHALFS